MIRRLKRVAPLQAGKVLGILYGAMGLLFMPFFLILALVGAFAQRGQSPHDGAGAVAVGMMIAMGVAAPIMYGVMGFVFGVISAAFYNLIARWVGGLEFEIEDANSGIAL